MLVAVQIKDIVVDPKREVDLTALPPDEAVALIRKSYGFLAPAVRVEIQADTAFISFDDQKATEIEEDMRLAGHWRTRHRHLGPGDEYNLVDEFADMLGLRGWSEWKPDNAKE